MSSEQDPLAKFLVANDFDGLYDEVDKLLATQDWEDTINDLRIASEIVFHRNWLRASKSMLTFLDMPELFGVDADIFDLMMSLGHVPSVSQAATVLYPHVLGLVTTQLRKGGSTLFFNAKLIAESKSAGLVSELADARFRETLFILEEIDGFLESSEKDWFDASGLWRTGNGYRVLKAANVSVHINRRDYFSIRELLLRELDTKPQDIKQICDDLRQKGRGNFLALSNRLNQIIKMGIDSRGVRGQYEAQLQPRIDLEGLDDF